MPISSSSHITAAKRTRRPKTPYRHRNDIAYVIRHPTFVNLINYAKYFFFKTPFGRLTIVIMFLGIFHMYFLSKIFWTKYVQWLSNSANTAIDEF